MSPTARPRAARTVAAGVVLLVVVVTALFLTVEVLPGNPVEQALGPRADPKQVAALTAQLGLDRPVLVRYGEWLVGVLTGNPGRSAVTRLPVGPLIAEHAARSLLLGAGALLVVLLVAVPAGVIAGSRPGSLRDRTSSFVALAVVSVPEFVMAALLVAVFAFGLHWLPPVSLVTSVGGALAAPAKLVLPVVTLAAVAGAYTVRLVRAAVAEVAVSPHVEAARLAGISEAGVLIRHVVPAVRGQIAQVVALLVPYLAGGALVVENVFGYPGLGVLVSGAVAGRDAVLLSGTGAVLAAVSIAGFLAANLVQGPVRAR